MSQHKNPQTIAVAFGVFWTEPKTGLVVPCEAYTVDTQGNTTSGDHTAAEVLAGAYERGETFLTYEGYLTEAEAARSANACEGNAYSVRPLPAGTLLYKGETLFVVATQQPATPKPISILQTWKKHDLGLGWSVSFLSDGSASFYNDSTDKHTLLPKYSVDTLRAAIRSADADARA